MLAIFAVVLPILFWQQGPGTASELQKAGITQIAVPAADSAQWRTAAGSMSVESIDPAALTKIPVPGMTFRLDEASASRVPWVTSNVWRFLRSPNAKFLYDTPGKSAPLAAAEAFSYSATALIHTDANGVPALTRMLDFLQSVNSNAATKLVADIGFVDDGSTLSGEVMNLMVRDNLLFRVVSSPDPGCKLNVQLSSGEWHGSTVKDTDPIVHKIRAELNDNRRSVRIYGTSLVLAHLTGEPGKPRLHLLNYGAASRTRVEGFRVRVLGRYTQSRIHSFDSPAEKLLDYQAQSDATEFTVPELKTYAVIDLAP